jgi:hypothetical protein
MRYKVRIKNGGYHVFRTWLVKRSNVVGFQLHREEGPAVENLSITSKILRTSYYLRGYKYRHSGTWRNALKYKSYSKNNRGMI